MFGSAAGLASCVGVSWLADSVVRDWVIENASPPGFRDLQRAARPPVFASLGHGYPGDPIREAAARV